MDEYAVDIRYLDDWPEPSRDESSSALLMAAEIVECIKQYLAVSDQG